MNTEIAANQQFFNELTPDMLARIFSIDGYICSMQELMRSNLLEQDVDHISIDDAKNICALEPGQEINIGLVNISRVA